MTQRKDCHRDWDGHSGSDGHWDKEEHHEHKCRHDWDDHDFHKSCVDNRKINKFKQKGVHHDSCCRKSRRVVIHCVCGKCIPVERKSCCNDW